MNGANETKARVLRTFLIAVAVLAAFVFAYSCLYDFAADALEPFELAARAVGYAVALMVDVLSARHAGQVARGAADGRSVSVALWASVAGVAVLCVHDVLLFEEYGNQLEGLFPMTAFFALDAALLATYVALLVVLVARKKAAPPALLAIAVVLWALYVVADMAGYPCAAIPDWDEAVLKMLMATLPFVLLVSSEGDGACGARADAAGDHGGSSPRR